MSVRRSLRHALLTAVPLALLTGCGSAVQLAAGTVPLEPRQSRQHRIEAARADCMKQRGFKYIPYVHAWSPGEDLRKSAQGDLAAMKRHREKYGYGVFALYVHPAEFGNPMVKPDDPPPVDPNLEIQSRLSRTQRKAYFAAYDDCYAKAVHKVTGKRVTSVFDHFEQAEALAGRLVARELDGDAELVQLAAGMARCLMAKGYAISSAAPTALAARGPERFRAEENALGRPIPAEERRRLHRKADRNARYAPNLTAEQARPYLDREIKDALDDLKCGQKFYPVYEPAATQLRQRAYREFGLEG